MLKVSRSVYTAGRTFLSTTNIV